MRKYLLLLLISIAACTPKVAPSTDARTIAALKVKEVVIAIGTIQHAAIEFNKQGVINNEATEYTIDYIKSALNVIKTTPNGWRLTVVKILDELEGKLNANAKDKLSPYIDIAKILILRLV